MKRRRRDTIRYDAMRRDAVRRRDARRFYDSTFLHENLVQPSISKAVITSITRYLSILTLLRQYSVLPRVNVRRLAWAWNWQVFSNFAWRRRRKRSCHKRILLPFSLSILRAFIYIYIYTYIQSVLKVSCFPSNFPTRDHSRDGTFLGDNDKRGRRLLIATIVFAQRYCLSVSQISS